MAVRAGGVGDFEGFDAVGGTEDEAIDVGVGALVAEHALDEVVAVGAEAAEVEALGFAEHEGGGPVIEAAAEVAERVMFLAGVAGVDDFGT